jgi:hypothetical protein
MKTYIVYAGGREVGTIKAGSHNAAEKKARKRYAPSADRVEQFMRINPMIPEERVRELLTFGVSVAYTEI